MPAQAAIPTWQLLTVVAVPTLMIFIGLLFNRQDYRSLGTRISESHNSLDAKIGDVRNSLDAKIDQLRNSVDTKPIYCTTT